MTHLPQVCGTLGTEKLTSIELRGVEEDRVHPITLLVDREGTHMPLGVQEELSAVFKAFNASGSGKMSAEEFQTQFRGFYMCKAHVSITDSLVVKNGKNLQKLEIGEVVQELQELDSLDWCTLGFSDFVVPVSIECVCLIRKLRRHFFSLCKFLKSASAVALVMRVKVYR